MYKLHWFPRLTLMLSAFSFFGGSAGAQNSPEKKLPPAKSHQLPRAVGVLIGLKRTADTTKPNPPSNAERELLLDDPSAPEESRIYRSDDVAADSPYETVWLSISESGVTVRHLQDIVVPRQNSFWRVGTNTSRLQTAVDGGNSNEEDFLWAVPVENEPTLERLTEIPCMQTSESLGIDYVGPTYIATTFFWSGTCAHYDESQHFGVRSLDTRDEIKDGFVGVLGPAALRPYEKMAATLAPKVEEDSASPAAAEEDPDPCSSGGYSGAPTDWTIRHEHGRWKAFVKFHCASGGICGRWEIDRELPAPLPRAIFGPNRLPVKWSFIEKQFPNITDAFASPDDSWIVIVTGTQLTLLPVRNQILGKPAITASIPHGNVVMAEWSYGRHTSEWEDRLSKLPPPAKNTVVSSVGPN